MKELIIIKIGGSVITDKSTDQPTARLDLIKNISDQITQLYNSQKYQIILIHGAGSFGHPIAKKYNTYKGAKTDKQKLGVCLTHEKMMELNLLLIKNLLQNEIPAVIMAPHTIIKQKASKVIEFNTNYLTNYLEQDYIPILYGDTVLDSEWGSSIISGDTITAYLGNKMPAKKIIFLSNVDGIFESDPKVNSNAKLINSITNENYETILQTLDSHHEYDISGEMKGKLQSIHDHLRNKEILITNGLKKDQLLNVLSKKDLHTTIHFV